MSKRKTRAGRVEVGAMVRIWRVPEMLELEGRVVAQAGNGNVFVIVRPSSPNRYSIIVPAAGPTDSNPYCLDQARAQAIADEMAQLLQEASA